MATTASATVGRDLGVLTKRPAGSWAVPPPVQQQVDDLRRGEQWRQLLGPGKRQQAPQRDNEFVDRPWAGGQHGVELRELHDGQDAIAVVARATATRH